MVLLNVVVYALAGVLGLFFLLQTLHRITSLDLFREPEVIEPTDAVQGPTEPAAADEEEKEDNSEQQREYYGAHPSAPPPVPTAPGRRTGRSKARSQRESLGALERLEGLVLSGHVKTVFRTWVIVFALVGAQMSWVLRPFIGDPDSPFAWFRPRGSNFFTAVFNAFLNLF